MMRTLVCCTGLVASCVAAMAQDLPDIPSLVQEVKQHQQQVVANQKNHTYRMFEAAEYGSAGWSREFDVSYENGHQINRMVQVNGSPLGQNKQQKIDNEVAKEVEKARKSPAKDPSPKDSVDIEEVLANMTYSNPRRDVWQSRPVILLDYTCTSVPKSAGMVAHVYGEIWIDEADKQVAKLEAKLQESKSGPRAEDPLYVFEQEKISEGSWLPVSMVRRGAQHMLGTSVGSDSRTVRFSDYKLKTGEAAK
jgi:hypothetical protein